MAPKLSSTQIDAKLADLRKFVEENLAILSQRRGTTLAKSLQQRQSADERQWYMFLTKKSSDFTAEQSEHLKQTFALLGTPSNAPTAGVPPPSSNEAMDMNDASDPPSRSGVPPPTENASAAATFSGSKAVAVKRKSSGSTSTASGAIPPTQRPRTGEADEAVETTLTAENWAELHEFDAWLETPEATRIRKGHVHTDKQTVQHLLVHPLDRVALQSVGSRLGVKQNREALVLWHDRCVQKALHDFRRWRQGLFASWTRKGPQPAPPDTMDAGTVVETVTEMREKQTTGGPRC